MFKLVQKIDVNILGCQEEEDLDLEFETKEEAQEYIDNHPELEKNAYAAAEAYFDVNGWIEIEEI